MPDKKHIIIIFGEMASGKSTIAKQLADEQLHLASGGFLEGDDVLNLPELQDLKRKTASNQSLNKNDIDRLVMSLIDEMKRKLNEHSILIVSQALYFDHDRRKIQDEFGTGNVSFVWVKVPLLQHVRQLFLREFHAYLNHKPLSIMNYIHATLNGLKSIATNFVYSLYFEKPAENFVSYSSWMNYFHNLKTVNPVKAAVLENNDSLPALSEKIKSTNQSFLSQLGLFKENIIWLTEEPKNSTLKSSSGVARSA